MSRFGGKVEERYGKLFVTQKSMLSGKVQTLELPISLEEFNNGVKAWDRGQYIQDAFPYVPADLREFIKTGVTPEEWNAAFPPEEE